MVRKATTAPEEKQDDRHLCRWFSHGERCQNAWSVSDRTDGGAGLCHLHAQRKAMLSSRPDEDAQRAEEFLAKMRATLKRPKPSPREHWERLLARSAPGSISHQYATEALKKLGQGRHREPGEDDEELAA